MTSGLVLGSLNLLEMDVLLVGRKLKILVAWAFPVALEARGHPCQVDQTRPPIKHGNPDSPYNHKGNHKLNSGKLSPWVLIPLLLCSQGAYFFAQVLAELNPSCVKPTGNSDSIINPMDVDRCPFRSI